MGEVSLRAVRDKLDSVDHANHCRVYGRVRTA